MTDDRHNLKIGPDHFQLLKAAKPAGYSWGEFLTESLQASTGHVIEVRERDGPTGDYILCVECGRSENTITRLNGRPCESGIPVDE